MECIVLLTVRRQAVSAGTPPGTDRAGDDAQRVLGSQQVLAAGMVGGGSSDAEQYSHDRRIMVYPVRSWHALLPL